MQRSGLIIRSLGGFYYVECDGDIVECRARGVLRKQGITPAVGDRCVISSGQNGLSLVDEIEPRKNCLVRPFVANIDRLFIVVSSCEPQPNTLVTDRLMAAAVDNDIEPVVLLTKLDLADIGEFEDIYRRSRCEVIRVDYETGGGIDRVVELMTGCTSAFAGNSGVGKSTLLNRIAPELLVRTGETSAKLGRGRHTTRHVELYDLPFGGKIADTPGFSSFDEFGAAIRYENLQFCFPEFADCIGRCKFTSCAHLCEKGCEVIAAVERGEIAKSRHRSYVTMYEEAKKASQTWN